jgi:hypothetical protein
MSDFDHDVRNQHECTIGICERCHFREHLEPCGHCLLCSQIVANEERDKESS